MLGTETDRADFAEKPATMIARSNRAVLRVKVTGGFVLQGEMDSGAKRKFFMAFRKNVGLNVRMACRTMHWLARNK